ncbi:MAG: Gfo/Idh/MocA family oxidoreductase [Oscillospiraceae bacterium]|nr:Gfo/Idh/MocA family oxidoreductase [Oscillospiraceae bacterium]
MSKKIGYAVVGLGVGRSHCDAAYSSKNANLVAVCDLLEDRLESAKKAYEGTLTYKSFEEMLKNPDIDIVSIAVPSGLHAELAVQALEAGKNILVEKPIDITVAQAMKIEQARVKTGLKVGVIHQNRFNAVMEPVKEAVDSGKIGKLILGTFAVKWFRDQNYYDAGGWRGTWAMDGGGSLMNQAVHTVDLMQWLMGDVYSVTSTMGIYNHKMETEDLTVSIVKFKSGAVATFTSSTCCYPGICTDIQLYGSNGSIEVDGDALKLWKISGGDSFEENDMLEKYGEGNGAAVALNPTLVLGHAVQVEDIISAVIEDRAPLIVPLEAIKSVRIINAVYESAKTGKEIFIVE